MSEDSDNFFDGIQGSESSDFTDRADALLRWRGGGQKLIDETATRQDATDDSTNVRLEEDEKTAAQAIAKFSEMEKHTCGDCGKDGVKCACGDKTAEDKDWKWRKGQKIVSVRTPKDRYIAIGDKGPQRITASRGFKARGDVGMVRSLEDAKGKKDLHVIEIDRAKKSRRGLGILGAAGGAMAGAAGGGKGALIGGAAGAALGYAGGHALGRSAENKSRRRMKLPTKGFFGKDPLSDAATRSRISGEMGDAKSKSISNLKNRLNQVRAMEGRKPLKDSEVGSSAYSDRIKQIRDVKEPGKTKKASGPFTSAVSSVNTQSGELTAMTKTAGVLEDAKKKLLDLRREYKDARLEVTTGPEEKKARLPKPPEEILKVVKPPKEVLAGVAKTASMASRLRMLKDPAWSIPIGAGAALGGTGAYLASRPKKELGGRSNVEAEMDDLVASQKVRGEEDASLPHRLKNRYVEFSKGVSTDFRKSPGGAAVVGAAAGATTGALAAKILGAGRVL